jgi:multiple sugar transport system permease protein
MFSVIGSFQLFTEPSLLQGTAPTVIGANYTPNLYAYSLAFTSQEPDYAAAVSFLLGLIMMIISYVALYAASRRYRR